MVRARIRHWNCAEYCRTQRAFDIVGRMQRAAFERLLGERDESAQHQAHDAASDNVERGLRAILAIDRILHDEGVDAIWLELCNILLLTPINKLLSPN